MKQKPISKLWQVYDGKVCGTVTTISGRIIAAAPEFQRFVGQLLTALPRQMQVSSVQVVSSDGRDARQPAG